VPAFTNPPLKKITTMKTLRSSLLVFAAALTASALLPLSAAANDRVPRAYPVRDFTTATGDVITAGDTAATVRAILGHPLKELAPDVWTYRTYRADLDLANDQGCDTIVITFAHNKVVDMKLVNDRAVAVLAASSSAKQAQVYVASR
jgi:hypothetical protein